jgi:GDP/UDP-N,N'-diacetylbacillosamine 2-epimerase (hydrolysing)
MGHAYMKKKTVLVVTGTRAEYGLLRSTMDAIALQKSLELKVLVTGMHTLKTYGNTQSLIKKDRYPIAKTVSLAEGDQPNQAFAKELIGIGSYLEQNKPDLLLLLGDRDEPMAAAIAAAHLQIPIAHIHGGDRSGYVIDEFIRHSLTKFSHLHFTISPSSTKRVLQLGEEKWRVHTVGAPGFDQILFLEYPSRVDLARTLKLDPNKKWMLVLEHPTVSDSTPLRDQIAPLLNVITEEYPEYEKAIIYPNSDTGSDVFIKEIEKLRNRKNVHLFRSLPREEYLSLMKYAAALVGNSSSGIIESGALKIPTLNIGGRQRGRERGKNVIEVEYDISSIRKGLGKVLSSQFASVAKKAKSPYGTGGTGKKIAALIARHINDPRLPKKDFIDK